MTQEVRFTIDKETGQQLIQRIQPMRTTRQPTGTTFYDLDWPRNRPITAIFEHGANTVRIPFVFGGLVGVGDPQELITDFHLYAALSVEKNITHDAARLEMQRILKSLLDAGWQRVLSRGDPRLKGKQATWYFKNKDSVYSLDPSYSPPLEEWMTVAKTGSVRWTLHCNGIYLEINMHPDQERMDPYQPSGYIINYEFLNEVQFYKPYLDSELWEKMPEHLPAELEAAKARRQKAEEALKAQGVPIDTSYQDPPILMLGQKAPQPVKPPFKYDPHAAARLPLIQCPHGQVCPQTGYWRASIPGEKISDAAAIESFNIIEYVKAGERMKPAVNVPFIDAKVVWTWVGQG